jgi:calpain-7
LHILIAHTYARNTTGIHQRWTAELQRKLNYDVEAALRDDNGEFWIDLNSLREFWDVAYISWNPNLFPHTKTVHALWQQQVSPQSWRAHLLTGALTRQDGPVKDHYNMSNNPQYALRVTASAETEVWVQLTRHITDIADFADNKVRVQREGKGKTGERTLRRVALKLT